MRAQHTQERYREAVSREELLSSLSALEHSLQSPVAPKVGGGRDLVHLESALKSWIEAADAACGMHAIAEEPIWAAEAIARFRFGQRDTIMEIHRLILETDDAESAEEIAHLIERARDAVANAVRLQARKQRVLASVLDGDLGEGGE